MKIVQQLVVWVLSSAPLLTVGHNHHSSERKLDPYGHSGSHSSHRKCSFHEPRGDDLLRFESKVSHAKHGFRKRNLGELCKQCIAIPTYFTIFTSTDPDSYVIDQATADSQFDTLVQRFSDTPFTFELKGIQWIQNETWYNKFEGEDTKIGSLYRVGGRDTLNCYFGAAADDGSFASFPTLYLSDTAPADDGTFNEIYSMPDVGPEDYCCREGLTLVHEVGHWLGLHHTFNNPNDPCEDDDESCVPPDACVEDNPNDYVDDTPVQATFTDFECPAATTDTCKNLPGNDPIDNYMDYSSDDCYERFTPGQIERMYLVWNLFRVKNEGCGDSEVMFEFELKCDDYCYENNWQLEATDGSLFINQITGGHGTQEDLSDANFGDIIFQDICIDKGKQYNFTMLDNVPTEDNPAGANDGIETYYVIRVDGVEIHRGGVFGASESTIFTTPSAGPVGPESTPQPTPEPTPQSTPESTPEPTSESTDATEPETPSFCFSADTTINVLGKGEIAMRNLQVGDQVLVDADKYERVYSFGHRDEKAAGTFIQFLPGKLELSEFHMVFIKGQGFIPAGMVKIGDRFHNGQAVEGTRIVQKTGVFSPFTPSGVIIVNGVKSSNYLGFQGTEVLMIGSWRTLFTVHWLSHQFQVMHRIWCHWLGFEDEILESGLSAWSEGPFKLSVWYLDQHPFVMGALLVPFVCVLVTLECVELLIMHHTLVLAFLALAVTAVLLNVRKVEKGRLY